MKTAEIKITQTIFESIGGRDPYFKTWQKDIHPILCEVAVNPAQIDQLFKSIESGSRTMLGKGIDAVKATTNKISDIWFNKFGGMLQSSAPVQAFDQKWENLKSSIAAKNPQLAAKLAKYGEFAKNNPNLHKFLLAIAGSAAAALGVAVAGGIGAGALAVGTGAGVATGILNIADRLLQGQAASTAIGRGATAGLVAGLTAAGATKLASMAETLVAKVYDYTKGSKVFDLNIVRNSSGVPSMPGFENGIKITGKEEDIRQLSNLWDQFRKAAWNYSETQNIQAMHGPYKEFTELVRKMSSADYIASLDLAKEQARNAAEFATNAFKAIDNAEKIAVAASGAVGSTVVKNSVEPKKINRIFESLGQQIYNRNLQEQFREIMEAEPKKPGLLSRAGSAVGQSFKGLTSSMTSEKLKAEWEKRGSPTDSEEIAKLLQDIGVNKELIDKTYTDLSLPPPAIAPAPEAPPAPATEPSIDPSKIPTPVDKTEPTLEPAPGATGPAPAPAPGATGPAPAPAPGATGPAPAAKSIFDDPLKLEQAFFDYTNNGGSIPPALRGILKDILLTALRKVESKEQKLKKLQQRAQVIEQKLSKLKAKRKL